MRRRALLALGAIALCRPATVLAQQPARVARVVFAQGSLARAQGAGRIRRVVLDGGYGEQGRARWIGWFAELGLTEGSDFSLTILDLGDDYNNAAALEERARAIVASRPDLVLSVGAHLAFALKALTRDIPIVFFNYGADPVRTGLVESLRRPGGNISGTAHRLTDMVPKFWELLRELKPGGRRGSILLSEEYLAVAPHIAVFREAQAHAAAQLGIAIDEVVVAERAPFSTVPPAIRKARADYLLVVDAQFAWYPELIHFVQEAGIPAIHPSPRFVRNGGLASVSPNLQEGERQAAAIAVRILRGEAPSGIPVHQATRYHTALNQKTAAAMRLKVPPSILIRVDEVVS